jgi:hypothetical protein
MDYAFDAPDADAVLGCQVPLVGPSEEGGHKIAPGLR